LKDISLQAKFDEQLKENQKLILKWMTYIQSVLCVFGTISCLLMMLFVEEDYMKEVRIAGIISFVVLLFC